MNLLVLGTTNPHKVHEVQSALKEWRIEPLPEGTPGIEETGVTFMENAILKSVHFSRFVDAPVLADDSGLCVDALNGRPGVLSARYADSDAARIQRLLSEMSGVATDRRQARFVCALAVAHQGEVRWTGEAAVEGRIAEEPRGNNGFGYDPVFFLPEFNRTMAELPLEEKNRISHRGRALLLLRNARW